jgi:hypothetical protein
MNKICFTTCANEGFLEGMKGLIRSIRKFYTPDEAEIVVFFESQNDFVTNFCRAHAVDLHYFNEIDSWRRPMLQSERFRDDFKHFYHERFQVARELPHHVDRASIGVDTIHHLHPLNVKAHCTAYCACMLNAQRIVHIDSDAFLLWRIDELFERHSQVDTVIAFDDGNDELHNLELLFGVSKPPWFNSSQYAINAGVVFYVNGPGIRELLTEFSFYIDSCYHYTYSGNFADQGVLRALIAKHHMLGKIHFVKEDGVNWNPTWFRADVLGFDAEKQCWRNESNGCHQYIWHGAGGEKLWTGRYKSSSVNEAWKWVGGSLEPRPYERIKGSLIKVHCQLICHTIAEHFQNSGKKVLRIVEIGTQYARTAIAFCSILETYGFDCYVDTFDIYAPSPDYPITYANLSEAQQNVDSFMLKDKITLFSVEACEDISQYIAHSTDVVFIDGDHRYKQVLSDCVVANQIVDRDGLIVGDDYQLPSVRKAVFTFFGRDVVKEMNASIWVVLKSRNNQNV